MGKSQTTKDIFFSNGEYSEDRKRLQDEIVRMFISDRGHNPEVIGLEAILMCGGSGAGKSRVIDKIIGANGYVLVDPDKIKELLPEYARAKKQKMAEAADIVHEESSDIALLLLKTCIKDGSPFIYDGTMKDTRKYLKIIKDLKSQDYTIQIVAVDAEVDIAYDRTKVRFTESGRLVERELVEKSNHLVSAAFQALCDNVDMYMVLENNSNTSDPKIIAYKDPDQEEVIKDLESYHVFLSKADLA